jgi:hypothetical protein
LQLIVLPFRGRFGGVFGCLIKRAKWALTITGQPAASAAAITIFERERNETDRSNYLTNKIFKLAALLKIDRI